MCITLAIPTHNRTELLIRSFSNVIDDDRISEIIIVDDFSNKFIWDDVKDICDSLYSKIKIKLYRNEKNLDCYRNKREAVSKATNEWVILLDSDNVIDPDYLDCIEGRLTDPKCILQPSFARPHFDFRKWISLEVNRGNIHKYMDDATFQLMLNACNYCVNRDEYLRIWDGSVDPVTSDSIYFMLKWFESGNSMYIVPGLQYDHYVHDGSHYRNNVRRTPRGFHDDIVQRLKNMR